MISQRTHKHHFTLTSFYACHFVISLSLFLSLETYSFGGPPILSAVDCSGTDGTDSTYFWARDNLFLFEISVTVNFLIVIVVL